MAGAGRAEDVLSGVLTAGGGVGGGGGACVAGADGTGGAEEAGGGGDEPGTGGADIAGGLGAPVEPVFLCILLLRGLVVGIDGPGADGTWGTSADGLGTLETPGGD